jgi:outer membrane protein assembly factor BamB
MAQVGSTTRFAAGRLIGLRRWLWSGCTISCAACALVLFSDEPSYACGGDCNGDGQVTIDELLIGVNIALGTRPLSACPVFDANMDAMVSVNELIAGVTNALNACPTPTGSPSPAPTPEDSVLEHHHNPSRNGIYVIPELTKAHAATLAIDPTFAPTIAGRTYAQPLYLVDPVGPDLVFVATEQNQVSAFSASNGTVAWQRTLAPAVPLAALPCGNIDPLGITGTPVIDKASRTIFLDAMTNAGGATPKHMIYALSIDDGSTRVGWPVDLNASVSSGGIGFDSSVQNQRAALALLDGTVYVAYGGHYGDCGNYYGWVIGVPITDPTSLGVFRTRDQGVAIWAPAGISSDGTHLYVATGNGFGGAEWGDSEAVLRLSPGPAFDRMDAKNYFAPTDWRHLDAFDLDLGGTAPVLVDLPGAVRSHLAIALGKDGKMYIVDRTDLGGIGGELLAVNVASNEIINAAASYRTPNGTYVVFKGDGVNCPNGIRGNVTAMRLLPTDPVTTEVAWCAMSGGLGSPMVTQTRLDGGDTIVWVIGSEGDEKLHGFDGDDGSVVFAGGGQNETMTGNVRRYVTPIAARGRIFVAGDDRVYAFK